MKKNTSNLFVAIIVLFISQGAISQNDWNFLGPENANGLTSLHLDTQNDILFAGTIEGFWYYDINSATWTSQIEPGWIGREVWSITSHPEIQGRTITGRVNAWFKGYMEISNDLGQTNSLTFNSDGGLIKDVKFCAIEPDIMFACGWSDITPGDLLKSTDGGQSWLQLTSYLHNNMTEIALHPNSTDTLYVSGDMIVTKSVDGGTSWAQNSNGLPVDLGVYSIAINPFSPQTLLCSNDNGVFRTENGGDNWEIVHNETCKHFAWHPVVEGAVASITFSPYKVLLSTNNGETWEDYTSDFPGDNMVDVVFSEDGTQLIVSSTSGVYSKVVDLISYTNPQLVDPGFNIFPNPAKDYFQISHPKSIEIDNISILSLSGQTVLEVEPTKKWIDISQLYAGVYLVMVDSKKNQQIIKLIVK